MDLTLWHNPRCSKSRAAMALLEERGHAPRARLYLTRPPSEAEIVDLLSRLHLAPRDLVRKGEALYNALGLAETDDTALIVAMATHPILIERPILDTGDVAIIARPPERVLDVL